MNFSVLSRKNIKCFKTDLKHIIISASDPYDEPPIIPNQENCLGTLRLKFHDWGETEKERIKKMESSPTAQKQVFFSEEDARKIVDFVANNIKNTDLIVCQCDAGISRSSAMAAALSKYITGSDEYFYKHYLPNSLVYRLLLNELHKGKVKV